MIRRFATDAGGPLRGVRVLDLSRLLSGNIMTHTLADLGADVIKVEPPEGDALRDWKVKGVSVQWKVYGRNKRSIALDLKAETGRETLRRLIATADMLVENFRPGVLDNLGFPSAAMHAINPRLVVVRISGWGQDGPYRHKPGFGTLVEAFSGFAAKNGFPDGPPVLPNLGLADGVAGIYAAMSAMVALREVEVNGGIGQDVDISLLDPILSILGADQAVYRVGGKIPTRTGNRSGTAAPRNIYPTRDGKQLALAASMQTVVERLFRAIGRPDLIADDRFATTAARLVHNEALDEIIGGYIRDRTLDEVLTLFEAAGVTAGPVHDAASLMEDAHVRERGSIIEVEDADLGSLPMHGVVPRFSRTPGALQRPAPRLDEHRAEILAELDGPAPPSRG